LAEKLVKKQGNKRYSRNCDND